MGRLDQDIVLDLVGFEESCKIFLAVCPFLMVHAERAADHLFFEGFGPDPCDDSKGLLQLLVELLEVL